MEEEEEAVVRRGTGIATRTGIRATTVARATRSLTTTLLRPKRRGRGRNKTPRRPLGGPESPRRSRTER